MADVELVIKIPEEYYKAIMKIPVEQSTADMLIIKNGIQLPIGHGDLKDMDDIYEALEGWNDDTDWIVDAIDFQAPTIIEAEPITTEGEFGIKKDNKLIKYWRRGAEYYKQPNGEGSWKEITEDEFNRAWADYKVRTNGKSRSNLSVS